ncbi:MAG TPA: HEAT repeat domain-containing protein [Terriglobia bacterium]|nr:HEAT repeat domain-containing protein [Terriglobia bacterium]
MFDFFRRGSQPSPRQIEKLVKRLVEPVGEDGPRIEAAERLADMNTPEATYALAKRFTISSKVITQDIEEKRMVTRMLTEKGADAVDPLLRFIKSNPQVDWPMQALSNILPPQELTPKLVAVLEDVAQNPFTSPEHRAGLIKAMHGHVTPEIGATLKKSLYDDDDDVRITAVEAIEELGDEAREPLLEAFVDADDRPRIRIAIAEVFARKEWPVKGHRPTVEANLPNGFHLNAKGVIRRRGTE